MHRATHRLIGVPFVDGGRDEKGYDCYGLAREVMRRFGHDVPEITVSCFDTMSIHAIYEDQQARWTWMKVEVPAPGDLAVMRLDPECPDRVSHVGVCVGEGRMIHTMKKRESHIVRIDDPYWSRKAKEWYRWVG